jgi:hypothetical protein
MYHKKKRVGKKAHEESDGPPSFSQPTKEVQISGDRNGGAAVERGPMERQAKAPRHQARATTSLEPV